MRAKAKSPDQEMGLTLVIGGTGKTGSRVVERLKAKGVPVRVGSRSAIPSFSWDHEAGWDACLKGVKSVYISYAPDLAIPGARDAIQGLACRAQDAGVEKLVLLSGRGEVEAQVCEQIIQQYEMDWTVVRASWFNQNFSEGAFADMVVSGRLTLPAGLVEEPFVDVDDIADVAVAALTEPGHSGEIYEVTGPRLMTFADIAADLSSATGREIEFVNIPHTVFLDSLKSAGVPKDVRWLLDYLFSTVLDGRNAMTCDGVERALGRKPKDFADYAREVAASGLWRAAG